MTNANIASLISDSLASLAIGDMIAETLAEVTIGDMIAETLAEDSGARVYNLPRRERETSVRAA